MSAGLSALSDRHHCVTTPVEVGALPIATRYVDLLVQGPADVDAAGEHLELDVGVRVDHKQIAGSEYSHQLVGDRLALALLGDHCHGAGFQGDGRRGGDFHLDFVCGASSEEGEAQPW